MWLWRRWTNLSSSCIVSISQLKDMRIDKNLVPLKQSFSRAMTTSRERLSNVFGRFLLAHIGFKSLQHWTDLFL